MHNIRFYQGRTPFQARSDSLIPTPKKECCIYEHIKKGVPREAQDASENLDPAFYSKEAGAARTVRASGASSA
jgi:hypothetical protein